MTTDSSTLNGAPGTFLVCATKKGDTPMKPALVTRPAKICFKRQDRASPATSRASRLREDAEEGKFGGQSGFSGGVGGASQAAIGTVELTVPYRLWPRRRKNACSCIHSACCCLLWYVTTQPGSLPGFSSSWKSLLSEHVTSPHNPADWPTLPLAVHSVPKQFQVCMLCQLRAIPAYLLAESCSLSTASGLAQSPKGGFNVIPPMKPLPCLSQGDTDSLPWGQPFTLICRHVPPPSLEHYSKVDVPVCWLEPLRAGTMPSHLHKPSSTQGTPLALRKHSRCNTKWH